MSHKSITCSSPLPASIRLKPLIPLTGQQVIDLLFELRVPLDGTFIYCVDTHLTCMQLLQKALHERDKND